MATWRQLPTAAYVLLVLGVVWSGLLGWFFLSPQVARTPELVVPPRPEVAHTTGPLVLAVLLVILLRVVLRLSRRMTFGIAALIMLTLSVGTELAQGLIPARSMEVSDLTFDLIGSGLGLLVGAAAAELSSSRRVALRMVNSAVAVLAIAGTTAAFSFQPQKIPEISSCGPSPASITYGKARPPVLSLPLNRPTTVTDGSEVTVSDGLTASEQSLRWTPDGRGMAFRGGSVQTTGPATGVIDAIIHSDQFTIEAVFQTDRLDQEGPARIATISNGSSDVQVNALLGIEGDRVAFRLRHQCSYFTWFDTLPILSAGRPIHAAVSYSEGRMQIHVDGIERLDEAIGHGDLDNWDRLFRVSVGNETNGGRKFVGEIYAVHLWDRALSTEELADRATNRTWDE